MRALNKLYLSDFDKYCLHLQFDENSQYGPKALNIGAKVCSGYKGRGLAAQKLTLRIRNMDIWHSQHGHLAVSVSLKD